MIEDNPLLYVYLIEFPDRLSTLSHVLCTPVCYPDSLSESIRSLVWYY